MHRFLSCTKIYGFPLCTRTILMTNSLKRQLIFHTLLIVHSARVLIYHRSLDPWGVQNRRKWDTLYAVVPNLFGNFTYFLVSQTVYYLFHWIIFRKIRSFLIVEKNRIYLFLKSNYLFLGNYLRIGNHCSKFCLQ